MPLSSNAAYPQSVAPSSEAAGSGSPRAASAPERVAIELNDVSQRLGHRWALRGISLRLQPGEVAAVVGPNGSGKTTLLRIVATSLAPTRGSGNVYGHDLVADADRVRALVAMLGHATGLYDDLTGEENLRFTLEMCGEHPAPGTIDAALDAAGARGFARERVRRLSSGMRRRVALARVLLRRPRLLLLDEPYNSFDAAGVIAVDALIRDTARGGGAVLVVTHDLGRMGAACDRVFSLAGGRVEQTS